MATVEKIAGFDAAAELSKNSKVDVSFATRAHGYGLYKVGTTGVGPDEADKPSILNVAQIERRQKWFAHEAAWAECGGDYKRAQELYIAFVEETNSLEPGHFTK